MAEDWMAQVPALAGLDEPGRVLLGSLSHAMMAPAGMRVFGEGSPCKAFLIVRSGQIRVCKTGETGREIVLYRVGPGETCIVTTACLMTSTDYDADGVAESDIVAQALPLPGFMSLLAQSAGFRQFVFAAYGARIADLLLRIEEVAFGKIDQRLASMLGERADAHGLLEMTHYDMAVELGTAREVVSRQLKEFERNGWVRLGRGQMHLLDTKALAALAQK
ncbi:MAG: Crp/Fnr family transcriptional regulator [Acidocella sp.]|nr:Crp/Fnr family transcriptional regulator [Acidocella sp.]